MKKALIFGILALLLVCCIACSDSDDTPSPENPLESPQKVLQNIDTDITVSARSARITVADTGKDGKAEYYKAYLSGERDRTYAILTMLKTDVSAKIGSLAFGTAYTETISANKAIDKADSVPITITKLQVNLADDGRSATVYGTGTVALPKELTDGTNAWTVTHKFILICTPNNADTLDTELYMELSGTVKLQSYEGVAFVNNTYIQFVRESTAKKTMISYLTETLKKDNATYEDMTMWKNNTITADGVEGYKNTAKDGSTTKHTFWLEPNYVALTHITTEGDISILDTTGHTIRTIDTDADGAVGNNTWKYNLTFLKDSSGSDIGSWIIASDTTVKKTDSDSISYAVEKKSANQNQGESFSDYYLMTADVMESANLSCTVSDTTLNALTVKVQAFIPTYDTHAVSEPAAIKENGNLKTALANWQ